MADTENGFKRAGEAGSNWDQDATPVLRGFYRHKKTDVGPNHSNIYQIEVPGNDEFVDVWGSTVLDSRFEEIAIGDEVIIEYQGKKAPKSGGKPYHNYDVQYRTPEGEELDGEALKEAQDALPDPKDV